MSPEDGKDFFVERLYLCWYRDTCKYVEVYVEVWGCVNGDSGGP